MVMLAKHCPQLADLLKHLVIPAKCLREMAAEMTGCIFQHIKKTSATAEDACTGLNSPSVAPVSAPVLRGQGQENRGLKPNTGPSLCFSTLVLRTISSPKYTSELSQVLTPISDITSCEVKSPSSLNPLQSWGWTQQHQAFTPDVTDTVWYKI